MYDYKVSFKLATDTSNYCMVKYFGAQNKAQARAKAKKILIGYKIVNIEQI